jgi:hypothetical protein
MWLFVCLILTRFQPRSAQLCLDAKGWRTADTLPKRHRHRPTSPYQKYGQLFPRLCMVWLLSTTVYISSLEVTCLPAFVFLELIFPCVCRTRSIVSVNCFRARRGALPCVSRPLYLQSPPNDWLRLFVQAPRALRAWFRFGRSCSSVFCCLPLGSYVAMVCGVTCRRTQPQQHFVVTQLRKSDALLVRVVEPTEHESSRANIFRPCRVVSKGHHSFDTRWGQQWAKLSDDP